MGIKKRDLVLWVLILFPYLCLVPLYFYYLSQLKQIENSSMIIINKGDFTLSHYNFKGELLQKSDIALGKNPGNKLEMEDLKTPEGIFRITGFENSSTWSHDFKDDSLGIIKGAYGPYFIRLNVPGQKGIGIHGTYDGKSIGARASEGCIRMHNQDVVKLVKHLKTASVVVIIPGMDDQKVNYELYNESKSTTKPENVIRNLKDEIDLRKNHHPRH